MDKHVTLMGDLVGLDGAPITAQLFGNAALEYMNKNGIKPETLAKIAYKNHKHSVNNPLVNFSNKFSLINNKFTITKQLFKNVKLLYIMIIINTLILLIIKINIILSTHL